MTRIKQIAKMFNIKKFRLLSVLKQELTLAHQPFEKLGEVPYETSVEKCVTVDVSHIIFWR